MSQRESVWAQLVFERWSETAEDERAEKSAWRAPLDPVLPQPLAGNDLKPDGRG